MRKSEALTRGYQGCNKEIGECDPSSKIEHGADKLKEGSELLFTAISDGISQASSDLLRRNLVFLAGLFVCVVLALGGVGLLIVAAVHAGMSQLGLSLWQVALLASSLSAAFALLIFVSCKWWLSRERDREIFPNEQCMEFDQGSSDIEEGVGEIASGVRELFSVSRIIKDNPTKSLLGAAAVGAFFGFLTFGKRRNYSSSPQASSSNRANQSYQNEKVAKSDWKTHLVQMALPFIISQLQKKVQKEASSFISSFASKPKDKEYPQETYYH